MIYAKVEDMVNGFHEAVSAGNVKLATKVFLLDMREALADMTADYESNLFECDQADLKENIAYLTAVIEGA